MAFGTWESCPSRPVLPPVGMHKSYSAEWINLLSHFPRPRTIAPPRSGASWFSLDDDSHSFIFGGYAELQQDTVPKREVVNDLWQFLPYEETGWGWTLVPTMGGSYPGPRLASAMATVPSSNVAVLMGGWDPQEPGTGGVILEDVAVLDLDSWNWSLPRESDGKVTTVPGGPTSRHVAVAVYFTEREGAILMHNHRSVDHVWLLTIDAGERIDGIQTFAAKWKRQETLGQAPSSRGLHCAAALQNVEAKCTSGIVLFGGAAKDGNMSNEAFFLDLKTWEWKKLKCMGEKPSPRAGACLCALDEETILLFGGAERRDDGLAGLNDVWILYINKKEGIGNWQCLIAANCVQTLETTIPPGRNAASLVRMNAKSLLPPEICQQYASEDGEDIYFLLQGGWNPFQKTFNDVFVLRIVSQCKNKSI